MLQQRWIVGIMVFSLCGLPMGFGAQGGVGKKKANGLLEEMFRQQNNLGPREDIPDAEDLKGREAEYARELEELKRDGQKLFRDSEETERGKAIANEAQMALTTTPTKPRRARSNSFLIVAAIVAISLSYIAWLRRKK